MQRKFRPRKKVVAYFSDNSKPLDYKDVNTLKKFISERGKILPRRVTGATAKAGSGASAPYCSHIFTAFS